MLVVGLGEALWDILPDGKKIGGAPANFAYHVSQFGLDSCVCTAIGADRFGDELLESFASRQLQGLIPVVPYPTGSVEVELDEDGVPSYNIKENVAWDNIPWTPELEELSTRVRAVIFGSLAQRNVVSRDTIRRFLEAVPDSADCYKIFDINLRQNFYTTETLHDSMNRCNILKINDEELVIVSRLFALPGIDLEAKCRTLLEQYDLKMLILTCGVNGSYVFTSESVSYLPTPKVNVVDTVGAGDSFTGAFTAALIKGRSIPEAHKLAVDVSAYVCGSNGAMPELPESLLRRLA